MKKSILGWLSVVSVSTVLALAGPTVRAQEDASQPLPPPQTTPPTISDESTTQNAPPPAAESDASRQNGLVRVTGTVRAIDPTTSEITVKGWVLSKTLMLTPATTVVTESATNGGLEALQVGDKIEATCRKDGKQLIAERIVREASDQARR